jgi:cytochrome c-type biogenesis protein CcmH
MPSPEPGPHPRGRRAAAATDLATALLAALGLAAACLAPPAAAATEDPAEKIESRLMCYCGCTDLTVHVCNCGTAAGIKSDIRQRLATGQSPGQIVDAYVAQYGEQILSAPTTSGFNLLAWVTPFAVLFAAGAAVTLLVRRWGIRGSAPAPAAAAHAAEAPPAGTAAASSGAARAHPPDRKTLERIERAIRESL